MFAELAAATVIYYTSDASHYPVEKAVADWNLSDRIHFVREPIGWCQEGHNPCVDITVKKRPPVKAAAVTLFYSVNDVPRRYWQIRLGPAADWTEHGERSIVCHELGHVLNVPHGSNCMRYYVDPVHYRSGAYNRSLIVAPIPVS
jgi:hypothetical protein